MLKILMAGCLLLAATAVQAKDQVIQLTLKKPITEQLAAIDEALKGEDYSEISVADRNRVVSAMSRIRARTNDTDSAVGLKGDEEIQTINDQQIINTVLAKAHDDSRIVCRSEKVVGSNRSKKTCFTVAKRREMREEAQRLMNSHQQGGTLGGS